MEGGREGHGAFVQVPCVPGHGHRLREVALDQAAQRHGGGSSTGITAAGGQREDGGALPGSCGVGLGQCWLTSDLGIYSLGPGSLGGRTVALVEGALDPCSSFGGQKGPGSFWALSSFSNSSQDTP